MSGSALSTSAANDKSSRARCLKILGLLCVIGSIYIWITHGLALDGDIWVTASIEPDRVFARAVLCLLLLCGGFWLSRGAEMIPQIPLCIGIVELVVGGYAAWHGIDDIANHGTIEHIVEWLAGGIYVAKLGFDAVNAYLKAPEEERG